MARPKSRRVWVVGALGRMGACVREVIGAEPGLELGAALEAPGHPRLGERLEGGVTLGDDAKAAADAADLAIDFSVPPASLAALRAAAERGIPYVCGTTGFSDAERAEIAGLARRIPVLLAPNFSLAVNVLTWLTREAARRLGPGWDAELVELHHAAKRDAPSGTALRLAEAVAQGRGEQRAERLVLERAGETGPRPEGAIGIQTLRGGDNPGEHTVHFVGRGERLELTHRAHTRDHFARGAVRAALWLADREPGLYRADQAFGLE